MRRGSSAVPRIPNATLRRSHLLDRLHAAGACRLLLVSAPAGSGKSALLASWVGELDGPCAWLAAGDADADGPTFWRRLARAVTDAWPESEILGSEVLDEGHATTAPVELCDRLRHVTTPGVVVIDDFHLVGAPPTEVVAFIAGLPPAVRLVLATRVDPPFSLARMRLHGTLLELRQTDLAFSETEARSALGAIGVELAPEEFGRLYELTEGWPAGVQLLGISLRDGAERTSLLDAAGDRHLAEFLINEVVDRQREEIRQFLMTTAELESFDPELCDELTGRDDSALLLEEVRAGNLFLVEQPGSASPYRYHHLFRDFLRLRLRTTDRRAAASLHRRAGAVYHRRGDPARAVHHLLAGDDVDAAREVLGEQVTVGLTLDLDDGALVARRWLQEYGEAQLRTDPSGLLECTMALHISGAVAEAELWLRRWRDREPSLAHTPRVLLHGAWSFHHQFLGDPEAALMHARRAADLMAVEPVDSRWADSLLVLLLQAQLWLGHLDDARAEAEAGLERPSLPPPLALVRLPSLLALADLEAGDLARAEEVAARALRTADGAGLGERHFGRAEPELVLASVAVEWGRLDEAADRLERVMRIAERRRPQVEVLAHLELARLADARHDHDAVAQAIGRAHAAQPHASAVVHARIDEVECRCAVGRGELVLARKVHERLPASVAAGLLAARIALAEGEVGRAREELAAVGERIVTPRQRLEHGLLRALVERRADPGTAARVLADTIAAADGFHRSILAEGPVLWELLAGMPAHGPLAARRDALLDAARREVPVIRSTDQDELVERLSERELTVLRYLASRLDSSEIAEALYLSVNTVRTHVKAIYRKLGVSSRTDAVARARELGLL